MSVAPRLLSLVSKLAAEHVSIFDRARRAADRRGLDLPHRSHSKGLHVSKGSASLLAEDNGGCARRVPGVELNDGSTREPPALHALYHCHLVGAKRRDAPAPLLAADLVV